MPELTDKQRTVPPSRFQRTIVDKSNNSLTIIDASSTGVVLGPGTTYPSFAGYSGGVSIFAEKVTIRGPTIDGAPSLAVPDADLTISCNELDVFSPNRPAPLSTHGIPGLDSASGKEGGYGHNIQLYVGRLSPTLTNQLQLDARGGSGGNPKGADAKEGGGDGGSGGSVTLVFQFNLAGIQAILRQYKTDSGLPATWNRAEEPRAPCVIDRDPIMVDLYRTFNSIKHKYSSELIEFPDLLSLIDAQLAIPILPGENPRKPDGSPERSIYTVTIAVNRTIANIKKFQQDTRTSLAWRCLVKGGPGGRSEDIDMTRGVVGSDGKDGSFTIYSIGFDTTAEPKSLPFHFAHPLQCAMLLERAKIYFYLGSQQNRAIAQGLLESLKDRLSFADDAFVTASQSKDGIEATPLLKSYFLFCGSTLKLQTLIKDLNGIRNQAERLHMQLTSTTVDYYGLPHHWVPRINHEAFQAAMKTALLHLQQIEDVYLPYLNAATQKEGLDQATATFQSRVDAVSEATKNDVDSLKKDLSQKYHALVDTNKIKAINDAQFEAEDGLSQLKSKISSTNTVNIKSVLNHLINFASGPNKFLGAVTAANVAYESFTSVPNIAGESVPKSLLIRQMTRSSNSVASMKKELLEVSASKFDGSLKIDMEFSNKILVEISALDRMLDEFAEDTFGSEAANAKTYLKNFSSLVVARNTEMVEYNLVLKTILSKEAETQKMQQTAFHMNREKLDEQNTAENLNNMTSLLETIYDNQRARVMRLLSFLQRALRYNLLTEVDHIDNEFTRQTKSDPGVNEAALSMSSVVLQEISNRLSAQVFDAKEEQSSDVSLFPANFDDGEGKKYRLSSSELALLRTNKQVNIRILPVDAEADESYERNSDFRGCADVRVYRVRFWMWGVKYKTGVNQNGHNVNEFERHFSNSRLVTIKLTHPGRETIINAENETYQFSHTPIDVTFSYRLSADGSPPRDKDCSSGDIVNFSMVNRKPSSVYAAPSPYTHWMISLEDFDKDTFDLTNVTDAVMEFIGTYRSFSSSRKR